MITFKWVDKRALIYSDEKWYSWVVAFNVETKVFEQWDIEYDAGCNIPDRMPDYTCDSLEIMLPYLEFRSNNDGRF